jgi:hypothetical protein
MRAAAPPRPRLAHTHAQSRRDRPGSARRDQHRELTPSCPNCFIDSLAIWQSIDARLNNGSGDMNKNFVRSDDLCRLARKDRWGGQCRGGRLCRRPLRHHRFGWRRRGPDEPERSDTDDHHRHGGHRQSRYTKAAEPGTHPIDNRLHRRGTCHRTFRDFLHDRPPRPGVQHAGIRSR